MTVAEKFVVMVTPQDAIDLAAYCRFNGNERLAQSILLAYDLWRLDNDLQDEYDREPY